MTHEQYLFLKLAEEASEVAQVASKAMQFGIGHEWPHGKDDAIKTNNQRLWEEIYDLMTVIDLLIECKYITSLNWDDYVVHSTKKDEKMFKYLKLSEELGYVDAKTTDSTHANNSPSTERVD